MTEALNQVWTQLFLITLTSCLLDWAKAIDLVDRGRPLTAYTKDVSRSAVGFEPYRRHHNAWTPRIRMFADLCSTALTCLPWGHRHRRSNLEMTKPLSHHRKQFRVVLVDLACEEISPYKLYRRINLLIILITYHLKQSIILQICLCNTFIKRAMKW